MNIRYLALLALPIVAFASGHEASAEGGTDFWWRLFNFLIFAVIVYKLVAGKIVDFFKNREEGIAGELSAIQDQLKEAKAKKAEALAKVDEAEKSASELLESAKKEAKLISEKIAQSLEHDKIQLEKSFNDRVEIETKKMKEEVVSEVIEDMFSSSDMKISNDDLLNIIKKKVA
jgi:F-type H+-transporting ATPase subunit b